MAPKRCRIPTLPPPPLNVRPRLRKQRLQPRRCQLAALEEYNAMPPIERIDDETLSILKQCPDMCAMLIPFHVRKYMSLPKDLPFHWEILSMFFVESWSLNACEKAIRPEPFLPEAAVHRRPRDETISDLQRMRCEMQDFLGVLREEMPRLGRLDFEIQKHSLIRKPGSVMFGCVRTLKHLGIIDDQPLSRTARSATTCSSTGRQVYRTEGSIVAFGSSSLSTPYLNLRACALGRAEMAE